MITRKGGRIRKQILVNSPKSGTLGGMGKSIKAESTIHDPTARGGANDRGIHEKMEVGVQKRGGRRNFQLRGTHGKGKYL